MADILNPIGSVFNSILAPLTSVSSKATPSSPSVPISSPSSSSSSRSTSLVTSTPTVATPSTAVVTSRTVTTAPSRSSSSDTSTTSTFLSVDSTTAPDQSTTSDVIPATSSLTTPTASFTTIPVANPVNSPPPTTSTSQPISSPPGNQVSTAGIVVAVIFAAGLLLSLLWLIVRYCAPIRTRYDTWSEHRKQERSWRQAIDGSHTKGISPSSTQSGRPFSFLNLNRPLYPSDDIETLQVHEHCHQNTNRTDPHCCSIVSEEQSSGYPGLGLNHVSMQQQARGRLTTNQIHGRHFEKPLPSIYKPRLVSSPKEAQGRVPQPLRADSNHGDSASSAPKLRLQIPKTATDTRISQIGLAVTSGG